LKKINLLNSHESVCQNEQEVR